MSNAQVVSNALNINVRTQLDPNTDRFLQANNTGDVILAGGVPASTTSLRFGTESGLLANVANAAGTINQLREAFALQRYAEARARYGSRYTEYLRYLGVRSSDARLQRPEYLGGGKSTMQFSEVLQTGPNNVDFTEGQTVGQMFGHGIASVKSNRYRRYFEEHGWVMSILQVMPKPLYSQGLPKMYSRQTKEDFFQKELQHIGQQEVSAGELYYESSATADDVWGWQDRYDEYRRMRSSVTGGFKGVYADWHFGRMFTGAPVLNDAFLRGPVTKRPFADQVDESLLMMIKHNIQARRMVSKNASAHVF